MASNKKIDGIPVDQFKHLMSPGRQPLNKNGELSARRVNWFSHGVHALGTFFSRLFYAIFVTHQWESDRKLLGHLWTHLNQEATPQNIDDIERISQELFNRLRKDDPLVAKVKEKIETLKHVPAITEKDELSIDYNRIILQLSGNHPWRKDAPQTVSPNTKEALRNQLKSLKKPEWIDEVIEHIESPALRKELRLELSLLRPGDLVCELSQGRIAEIAPESGLNETDGKKACASICVEAIFFMEEQKKRIESETDIYQIIQKGVSGHKDKGLSGQDVVFTELIKGISENAEIGAKTIAAFAPKSHAEDGPLAAFEAMRAGNPLEFPYQGYVKDGFDSYINDLITAQNEAKQKLYGVITCGAETVFAFANEDGTFSLFDSHGRDYLGVSKGASIRRFKNASDLSSHLQKLFKKEEPFSMSIIGIAEKKDS